MVRYAPACVKNQGLGRSLYSSRGLEYYNVGRACLLSREKVIKIAAWYFLLLFLYSAGPQSIIMKIDRRMRANDNYGTKASGKFAKDNN